MRAYLLKFDRELDKVNEYCVHASSGDTDSDELSKAVNDLCSQLNLDTHGYALSECRAKINASLARPGRDIYINNRRLKNPLIEKFGEDLCFTYSRKRQDSQMFFSSKVKSTVIAEQVRSIDVIIECAKRIRNQMKNYNFDLMNRIVTQMIFHSAMTCSSNRPLEWNTFCSALLDHEVISTARQKISDTISNHLQNDPQKSKKNTLDYCFISSNS